MTSPAEPAPTEGTQASQLTKPLRELAAFVLLGANAVFLFVGLIRLLTPAQYTTFAGRAGSAFFAFVGLEAVVLPVLAVLLVTHVRPATGKAKLITQVALVEYAVSALFGVLTILIWTVDRLAEGEILDAFLGLLTRAGWLALLALAAFVVFKIWRTLYYVPKPKPQPGVYGQPQPGWPQQQGGYPGQPGQPGQPAPGQPGGWAAPGTYGAPYGQQPGQFGGAQPTPPFNPAPQSGPPANAAPQSAPPFGATPSAPPFGQPPSAEPTQAIPRQSVEPTQAIPRPTDGDSDRTQHINPGDNPDAPR
ncbi:hypothetical protein GA0070606_2260 [Micromonospora citrea]|uniref:Uncharacterized protein n=1 Tax=Micromonospora citrea TaxID=47855 RepID=A0A1C6UJZ5_9ACTN|nr:hypothetical protein [Micromonospora citrea]SCL54301.1 hypothetical protein GA0070606_2260 [Micromonospora citrea]